MALGHVCSDLLAGGRLVAGGSALYAALTWKALGASARVVTSCGPDWAGDLDVENVAPAPSTTVFENSYVDGVRHQRVAAIAAPLVAPIADADVVFACPIAGEIADSAMRRPPGGLLAAGLQGWLRSIDPDGTVTRRAPPSLDFLAECDAVFCSEEDLGDDATRLLPDLRARVPLVIVTAGPSGGSIYAASQPPEAYAAVAAKEKDPTGAGDVFAATFLWAQARGDSHVRAAQLAAAAAAVVVEGLGPERIARLREVIAARP